MLYIDGFVACVYYDKQGRLLTTKEAWRELNKQFHGRTGGRKNIAKKDARYNREKANMGAF